MLKEREAQVTEEYDKVLREKLAGVCEFGYPAVSMIFLLKFSSEMRFQLLLLQSVFLKM